MTANGTTWLSSRSACTSAGRRAETIASWASADSGPAPPASRTTTTTATHLAVALLGDPGTPQQDKIYANLGGSFSTTPVWVSGDVDNSFSLAWGDADGDGDLDLAVACGESYTSVPQRTKVYRNDGGAIETTATWQAVPLDYGMDVAWGDVDNDGDLDLACGAQFGPNRIYLNGGSGLDSVPAWSSGDSFNTLQVAFGDVDGDGWLDLAAADNAQLGGASRVAVYRNLGGTLESLPSWSSADAKTYYSCVAFADVDDDGDQDLAAGGWWSRPSCSRTPAVRSRRSHRFLGNFTSRASWSARAPCGATRQLRLDACGRRAARWRRREEGLPARARAGPLDRRGPRERHAAGIDRLLQRPRRRLGRTGRGAPPPPARGNVTIDYVYSRRLDLVVTNWDPNDPSVAFLSTDAVGVATASAASPGALFLPAMPNPFREATVIPYRIATAGAVSVEVYDVAGRLVRTLLRAPAAAGSHEAL